MIHLPPVLRGQEQSEDTRGGRRRTSALKYEQYEENCAFLSSVVQWVYWVTDTLKLSPIFGLAKKVLMVLGTLLHREVASFVSSVQRLKISV